LKGITLNFA